MKLLEAGRQLLLHVCFGRIRERTGQRSAEQIGSTAQVAGLREASSSTDTVQCRLGVAADHIKEWRDALFVPVLPAQSEAVDDLLESGLEGVPVGGGGRTEGHDPPVPRED